MIKVVFVAKQALGRFPTPSVATPILPDSSRARKVMATLSVKEYTRHLEKKKEKTIVAKLRFLLATEKKKPLNPAPSSENG